MYVCCLGWQNPCNFWKWEQEYKDCVGKIGLAIKDVYPGEVAPFNHEQSYCTDVKEQSTSAHVIEKLKVLVM